MQMSDAVIFNTPGQIQAFQMRVFKQGLKALLRDMPINREYNSTNCRKYVSSLTGEKYPAGKKGIQAALTDLENLILQQNEEG
jgi:hypothetical protein|tara:strand:- start:2308 stop:2556 length:249 start_codon:yes stop_codon:yes gene_type:complete